MFAGFAGLGQALSEARTLAELNRVPALIHFKQCLAPRVVRFGLGCSASSMTIDVALLNATDAPKVDDGDDGLAVLQMLNLAPVFASSSASRPLTSTELNQMLADFAEQTGGAVVVERVRAKAFCKLVIEAATDLSDAAFTLPFRYSPSCEHYYLNASSSVEETIALVMMQDFYAELHRLDYMLDDSLRVKLEETLPGYFAKGIRKEREGFFHADTSNNTALLRYWMWGVPGIGKTEFIRCFARAMEHTVRQRLDPAFTVQVVKVPLNAMSCQTLNHILCIQGLSDWSVERMLEQSLARGHAVIMHLEEAPPDCQLQDDLSACVHRMLKKLFTRYPEYVANVVLVYTSNCEPSRKHARETVVCAMLPPTHKQREWLARKLVGRLLLVGGGTGGGATTVEIEDVAYPPVSQDVRPLNAWWMSIAYALLRVRGAVGDTAFVRRSADALEVGWHQGQQAEPLRLTSADGFFYTAVATATDAATTDATATRTHTIFDMCQHGFLTPAVVVLQGSPQWLASKEAALLAEWEGAADIAHTRIELLSHDDESKVLGDAGDVRGGLLKFIDDCTNPNSSSHRHRHRKAGSKRPKNDGDSPRMVCAVFARVNEIGSFLLRELLEPGDKSRTHRLGVWKTRLLFVVSLDTHARLTPQLESRMHQRVVEEEA